MRAGLAELVLRLSPSLKGGKQGLKHFAVLSLSRLQVLPEAAAGPCVSPQSHTMGPSKRRPWDHGPQNLGLAGGLSQSAGTTRYPRLALGDQMRVNLEEELMGSGMHLPVCSKAPVPTGGGEMPVPTPGPHGLSQRSQVPSTA